MDDFESVRVGPVPDIFPGPVMDENEVCPSVLGDVKGDAVFTYGLRKILKLLGFSIQTRWPRGRQTIKTHFLDHVPCLFRVVGVFV